MECGHRHLRICFLFVIFLYWPHVLAQEGYLSLACGRSSSFLDISTGIRWIPDDNYTSTGISWGTGLSSSADEKHASLRYFPKGNQNCYNFVVASGSSYFIRGTHTYLNHDGNSRPPEFDVAIDATAAYSVKLSIDGHQVVEVIASAQSGTLSYCLLTREGFPVISSLEIRPLPQSSYPDASRGLLIPVTRVKFVDILNVRLDGEMSLRDDGDERACGITIFDSWTLETKRFVLTSAPTGFNSFTQPFFLARLDSGIESGEKVFDITADSKSIGEHDLLESRSRFSDYIVAAGNPELTVAIDAAKSSRELACLNAIEIYLIIPTGGGTQDSDVQTLTSIKKALNLMSFHGRRLLSDSTSSTSNQGSNNLLKVFIGIAVGVTGFLALLAIATILYCYCRRRARVPALVLWTNSDLSNGPNYIMKSPLQDPHYLEMQSSGPLQLSMKEVQTITGKFKSKIGEGGFGAVYYGTFPDGTAVAVKVRSLNSSQGTREFTTELELLRKIKNDNLVPLVGYCTEYEQEILVYSYMSNGSLHDRLYDKSVGKKPLDWLTRLNIVLGAARGIHFLHTGGDRRIIHRDLKSSNILLDDSMKAKIADFGLSKVSALGDDGYVSTEVRGTAEYLDPEYYQTQQLTEMSDVYSFGIVLLETVCGREPLNMNRPRDERSLLEWVRPFIKDANIQQIVDPEIQTYTPEALWRVLEIALQSVEPLSSRRPTMASIVRELEDALIIENNASQYMASIQSLDSLCLPANLEMKDFPKKEPYPFELSPVF